MAEADEITLLLKAYEAGDKAAFDRLVPLVYDELRRMAHRHLRRGPRGATLDTTGLVHEAYLKLAGSPALRLNDRGHLMAVTARAMRQVVVSRARAQAGPQARRGRARGHTSTRRRPARSRRPSGCSTSTAPSTGCASATSSSPGSSSAASSRGSASRRRPRPWASRCGRPSGPGCGPGPGCAASSRAARRPGSG